MLLALVLLVVIVVALAILSVKRVPEHTWYVVERSGAYRTALEPGTHLIVPALDRVTAEIDMREQVLEIQEPLVTRDHYVVNADVEITYAVADPFLVYLAGSSAAPLEIAVRSALRQYAGVADRDDLIATPGTLADVATDALARAREDSGLAIEAVAVTDVSRHEA